MLGEKAWKLTVRQVRSLVRQVFQLHGLRPWNLAFRGSTGMESEAATLCFLVACVHLAASRSAEPKCK